MFVSWVIGDNLGESVGCRIWFGCFRGKRMFVFVDRRDRRLLWNCEIWVWLC